MAENGLVLPLKFCIDMFKQHENPLYICYGTKKSDIGTVVELWNIYTYLKISTFNKIPWQNKHESSCLCL